MSTGTLLTYWCPPEKGLGKTLSLNTDRAEETFSLEKGKAISEHKLGPFFKYRMCFSEGLYIYERDWRFGFSLDRDEQVHINVGRKLEAKWLHVFYQESVPSARETQWRLYWGQSEVVICDTTVTTWGRGSSLVLWFLWNKVHGKKKARFFTGTHALAGSVLQQDDFCNFPVNRKGICWIQSSCWEGTGDMHL